VRGVLFSRVHGISISLSRSAESIAPTEAIESERKEDGTVDRNEDDEPSKFSGCISKLDEDCRAIEVEGLGSEDTNLGEETKGEEGDEGSSKI
jgi:hypothetical protein